MSSWFSFSNTEPKEDTSLKDKIANLEDEVKELRYLVSSLMTSNRSLQKHVNRFLQKEIDELMEAESEEEEYYPEVSYQFLINVICENMTKSQFESYTTKKDMDTFESMLKHKPEDKLDFAYCYLITIARKAVEEENTSFNFVLNDKHKLSASAQSAFIASRHIKTKAQYCWDDFLCDYQYDELVM